MAYAVIFKPSAERALARLDRAVARRIKPKCSHLQTNRARPARRNSKDIVTCTATVSAITESFTALTNREPLSRLPSSLTVGMFTAICEFIDHFWTAPSRFSTGSRRSIGTYARGSGPV